MSLVTDPKDVDTTDRGDGQQKSYLVLSEEERAKGFVRPVRRSYKHVGIRPTYPLRDLTPEEQARHAKANYVKYEKYPEEEALVGRYWTQEQLTSGCGEVTDMSLPLAETYARQPDFYGATFCATCRKHFRVGEHGEFVWVIDGTRVGT